MLVLTLFIIFFFFFCSFLELFVRKGVYINDKDGNSVTGLPQDLIPRFKVSFLISLIIVPISYLVFLSFPVYMNKISYFNY